MKRFIVSVSVLALVADGGFLFMRSKKSGNQQVFKTAPVTKGSIQSTVTATGTLKAVTAVQVGAEVSGVIDRIYVEHNSKVKKGQLLAQINPDTLRARVDSAKASLDRSRSSYNSAVAQADNAKASVRQAEARLLSQQATARKAEAAVATARANVSNAEAQIYNAKANLARSRAEYANNKINYERRNKLYTEDLIPRSERDDAYTSMLTSKASMEASQASLESAQATLKSRQIELDSAKISAEGSKADVEVARTQVESAQAQAASAEASVAGAKAEVSQSEASLESAKVDLGKTSITSPIDGVVLSVAVSEGQTVASQYQTPELFKLAKNLDEMQVEATVDEADVGQIHQGDLASFTVDSWPDKVFHGKVLEIRKAAVTTNNVVTFPVIISTNNPDMCLIPGMTATVDISTVRHDNILLVPTTALSFKPSDAVDIDDSKAGTGNRKRGKRGDKEEDKAVSGATEKAVTRVLYTLDKTVPGRLVRIEVKTGLTDGSNTEIASNDLHEGDKVVTGSFDKSLIRNRASSRGRRGGPF